MKNYYVYIMSNKLNTVLYIGVTNDLVRRVWEHKNHFVDGFTKKYNVDKLVYFETITDIYVALEREKKLKKYTRMNKEKLIHSQNPLWDDLFVKIIE